MTSLGCAKKEECINPATNAVYAGEPLYINSGMPGGMTILPYCCLGELYNNDDANINFDSICNASDRIQPSSVVLGFFTVLFSVIICFI